MTMLISTITSEYDQAEDRIRFAAVDKQGVSRVMWITQRLAQRLVPVLVDGLNAQLLADEAPPGELQAAQVYAQLEARISQKHVPPVKPDPGAAQELVTEIKVSVTDTGSRVLAFICKDTEPARLAMTPPELRQWLEVLRLCFVKGQWREDVWPAWLKQRAPSKPT
jgi:hypothetical protein